MMKLLVCLLCLGSVLAYSLEDVTQSDASYKAIKRGVEQGYFSTFENGQSFIGSCRLQKRNGLNFR